MSRTAKKPLSARLIDTAKVPAGKSAVVLWDASVPGLGVRKSTTSTRWLMRLLTDGKQKTQTIGLYPQMGLADARAYVSAAKDRRERGEDIIVKPAAPTGPVTLQDGFDLWWSQHAEPNLKRPDQIKLHWARDLSSAANNVVLRDMTRGTVITIVDDLKRRKTPSTAAAGARLLSSVIGWLADREHCQPVAYRLKIQASAARQRVLNVEEIEQVLGAADEMGLRPGAVVRLCWFTACRSGEVAGLRWSSLNTKDKTLTLGADETKAGVERTVYLSDEALGVLEQARVLADGSDYVFPALRADDRPYDPTNLPGQIRRRLGWKTGTFRLHDLRRSAASALATAGFGQEVIKLTLGHQLDSIITGATSHYIVRSAYEAECRRAVEALADLV